MRVSLLGRNTKLPFKLTAVTHIWYILGWINKFVVKWLKGFIVLSVCSSAVTSSLGSRFVGLLDQVLCLVFS